MPEQIAPETAPKKRHAKKPRALSHQQRKLIKALPKAASVSEAGRIAGYSVAPAAHRALAAIQRRMPQILDRHGLTDDYLVEKCLKPGLNAKETKFFAHEGIVTDSRTVVAWGDRRAYLDIANRLRGSYPKEGAPNGSGITINLGIWPHSDAAKPLNAVREECEAT